MSTRAIFVSRGRGRGHAIPDLAICAELERVAPHIEVTLVSYGTGARTLREAGRSVVDLGMEDDAPFLASLTRVTRVISDVQPDLVVSHEEFPALPAAKICGIATLFIVDFFPPGDAWKECLMYADRVLFIESRGMFAEPSGVRGRVRYIGPVVREMSASRDDRGRCRTELTIGAATKVVSVIPGAWATEARAPVVDLVVAAFEKLSASDKALIWVAGADSEAIEARLGGVRGAQVFSSYAPIEHLMVASDVVLTKGNRGSTIDLASLGVPSVSLSRGTNPIDEAILPRIASNVALLVSGIDSDYLLQVLETVLERAASEPCLPSSVYTPGGALRVAREIAAFSEREVARSEALP